MKVYISVDMEGIAGVNHPHPTELGPPALSGGGRADDRRDQRRDRGRARGRRATDILVNDSHGAMFNLLPIADPSGRARPAGPEAVVDGRGRGTRTPGSMSRSSSATTPGPATRGAPSRTPIRARRSRRAWTAARPASTASTRSSSGAWGIPVGLVAGDDALAEEVDGVAAVGRAGRGQDRGRRPRGRVRPPDRRRRPRSGPVPSGRSVRAAAGEPRAPAGRAAGRHRGRLQPRRRGRPRGDRARGRAVRRPRRPLRRRRPGRSRIAASWPATGWRAPSSGDARPDGRHARGGRAILRADRPGHGPAGRRIEVHVPATLPTRAA